MADIDAEPSHGVKTGNWPVPLELPLYVTVEQAAKLAGIGRDLMFV